MAKCVVCAAMDIDTTVDEKKARQENLVAEYEQDFKT